MTTLNTDARATLADAGITETEWVAYGGWLKPVVDDAGNTTWVPETEWRGDACGCTDDRCIGYHHDADDTCWCLPVLIERREQSREAYTIWQEYRAAVEANDGRGDEAAYDDAWERAERWVRKHYPHALTYSLDAIVPVREVVLRRDDSGELLPGSDIVVVPTRGISATFAGKDPEYTTTVPEGGGYRMLVWPEGTTPNGHNDEDDA